MCWRGKVANDQSYCIDTSEFTAAYYSDLPAKNFVAPWRRISEFVKAGRLVAPIQVYKELQERDDDLSRWVREHREMFVDRDMEQLKVFYEIARDFPALSRKHTRPDPADPWVIALAKTRGLKVLCGEHAGSKENPKIPFICNRYGIPHGRMVDIVTTEGWIFE